jgi:hypothetical protein
MSRNKMKLIAPREDDTNEAQEFIGKLLSKGIGVAEEDSRIYNLAEEFGAAKANKSYPVYIAIISFTLVLFFVTGWLTYGIQQDIDRVSVGISDFKDLNLAELLGALKKAEQELGVMDEKIALAKRAMDLEVERIRRESDMKIKEVEKSGLGQAEKNRLIKNIREEQNRKMGENSKYYEERIRASQKEADKARASMATMMKKVANDKTDYEKSMKDRLKSFKKDADDRVLMSLNENAAQKAKQDAQMDKQKKEYKAVLAKYENELKASRNDADREAEKARDTEQLIKLYRYALNYYARTRGEHGYVIDPGTDGNMLVDVNPYIEIKKGDRAYVLNQENRILALVELQPSGIRMKAKVLERMLKEGIQPFDKILIKKK